MQETFARATHSAGRPSAARDDRVSCKHRYTLGPLVYNQSSESRGSQYDFTHSCRTRDARGAAGLVTRVVASLTICMTQITLKLVQVYFLLTPCESGVV